MSLLTVAIISIASIKPNEFTFRNYGLIGDAMKTNAIARDLNKSLLVNATKDYTNECPMTFEGTEREATHLAILKPFSETTNAECSTEFRQEAAIESTEKQNQKFPTTHFKPQSHKINRITIESFRNSIVANFQSIDGFIVGLPN